MFGDFGLSGLVQDGLSWPREGGQGWCPGGGGLVGGDLVGGFFSGFSFRLCSVPRQRVVFSQANKELFCDAENSGGREGEGSSRAVGMVFTQKTINQNHKNMGIIACQFETSCTHHRLVVERGRKKNR